MNECSAVDFNTISLNKISTDWDLISFVISKDEIDDIVASAAALTIQGGESPLFMESTILDLESLCTLDYRQLPELTHIQVDLMEKRLSGETDSVVDMFFLELRCTFSLGWKVPESNDDIRAISYHNSTFNNLIYRKADFLASSFGSNRYKMPYWLRLSQLRIMSHIPNNLINNAQLDKIFFFPIHRRGLNATSCSINGKKYVTANFGLNGILHELNRFIYHFQSTEVYSLGNREKRALPEIVPVVLYFLTSCSPRYFFPQFLFGQSGWKVKTLTDYQLDFIVLHEIAHHILEHPERASLIKDYVERQNKITKFEYEADTLANALMASAVMTERDDEPRNKNSVIVYADAIEAVELLFEHMNFIEQMEENIRSRFGGVINIASIKGAHPDAYTRLEYFHRIFKDENRPLSEIAIYARGLYNKMIDYCRELSNDEMASLMRNYLV
ncbi:TPA: hypothetical protein ACHB3M_003927 [Klebsiella quasipneumoniae subsp. similipneumoniae]|uniref:hypothetical protein n=1 Tax=Enterobacteriaceae TaxID=543 RepID=UPI00084703F5|nr:MULTISPECIES: hypothetical protein [Citrobacter]HBY5225616.1 hypothetical protein [Klebsiella pneumoniae]HDU5605187.1 hypothetical protein [Klebsiella pneumoniae subsp. ozaenae]MBQ4922599.1 hypothetical protein [Citrobacter werkmanii]MBQ4935887.1 hypothetical protein [Citrobacter werkmanii]MBQ4947991.1 hypothetical protein [Citrobacter werkmanii]